MRRLRSVLKVPVNVKIPKKGREAEIIPVSETVDNKLEILTFLARVQGRIKRDITEDFVLAKLHEKDKIAIINMTSNAYYLYKILIVLSERSKVYEWETKTKTWIKRPLDYEEKESIREIARATFDSIMTPVYMTVLLNRNVEKNHLVEIIAGANKEIEDTGDIKEESLLDKAKNMLKPNKRKPDDED